MTFRQWTTPVLLSCGSGLPVRVYPPVPPFPHDRRDFSQYR
jgi:hypothetical protein